MHDKQQETKLQMGIAESSAVSSYCLGSSTSQEDYSEIISGLGLLEDRKSQERKGLTFLNSSFSDHSTKPSGASVSVFMSHDDSQSASVIPDEWYFTSLRL